MVTYSALVPGGHLPHNPRRTAPGFEPGTSGFWAKRLPNALPQTWETIGGAWHWAPPVPHYEGPTTRALLLGGPMPCGDQTADSDQIRTILCTDVWAICRALSGKVDSSAVVVR